MMTRKDYQACADIFKDLLESIEAEQAQTTNNSHRGAHLNGERASVISLASRMATKFAESNPRFDCQRFIEACGIK